MSNPSATTAGTAPTPARKPQSLWNNHPFHYHIAAHLMLATFGALGALGLYAAWELHLLAGTPAQDLPAAAAAAARHVGLAALVLAALSLPLLWHLARRISSQLDILKRQAAAIRVFDFSTEIPLDTPIREIFGLGRAMRQMKETIQRFMRVSVALSGERDLEKLLARVIHEMREALDGDGGVIYLLDEDTRAFQPASQRWVKGAGPAPVAHESLRTMDPEHPVAEAVRNRQGATVHTLAHPRPQGLEFLDQRYGQATLQLVSVPLRASDSSTIGIVCSVVPPGKPTPSPERTALAHAYSSAAAVAIDQQRLLEAQKKLMDSMIRIMAGAIDAKSPYTGGHCARVPELGIMLAEEACKVTHGPLADFAFRSEDEWREFRIGAWLHDCGKVTTPEYVVDKATKLETIYNRIHEVRVRFEVLLRDARIDELQAVAAGAEPQAARAAFQARRAQLLEDFAFVAECNGGGEFMAPERLERLRAIAGMTWQRHFDDRIGLSHEELKRFGSTPPEPLPATEPLLADKPWHVIPRTDLRVLDPKWGFKVTVPENLYNHGEVYNLGIRRGTLTEEERFKINEHVIHSLVMLEQLPLPQNLKRVPEYAGTHHETLVGSGYPRGLGEAALSVPMRIMAIADIFEALTASDRPYKKSKTLSESVRILHGFKVSRHIDPALFDLFLSSGVYLRYAQRFLEPGQIDEVDVAQYLG